MPVAQPVVPVISLPHAVLFPHALLSIQVNQKTMGERFGVTAGEWFAEGAIWGLAMSRGDARKRRPLDEPVPTYRTLGIGCIVHRECQGGIMRRLVFEGIVRGRIIDSCEIPAQVYTSTLRVELLHDCVNTEGPRRKELTRAYSDLVKVARKVATAEPNLRDRIRGILASHPHPGIVADLLANSCLRDSYAKQCILEELNVLRRVQLVRIQMAQMIACHMPHHTHTRR